MNQEKIRRREKKIKKQKKKEINREKREVLRGINEIHSKLQILKNMLKVQEGLIDEKYISDKVFTLLQKKLALEDELNQFNSRQSHMKIHHRSRSLDAEFLLIAFFEQVAEECIHK